MRRKGISPLIAAVLLIAFTLAVAALLTAWVTTFTQDTTGAVGDESERLIDCSYASLSIYRAEYDATNEWLNISISNTGRTDLGNVTVSALSGGSLLGQSTLDGDGGRPEAPGRGEITDVGLTGISQEPGEVRVASTACPEITDQETSIQ